MNLSRRTLLRLRGITVGLATIATIGLALTNVDTVQAQTTEVIAGTDGPDELIGTSGDDTINGKHDADVMTGLAGNDTYIVDTRRDEVVEQADEGIDTVRVVYDYYALPPNVENLTAQRTQGALAFGNNLANRMIGNSGYDALMGGRGNDILKGRGGPDTLAGEGGNDVLTGGEGTDQFMMLGPLDESNNVDRILDFDPEEDLIGLSFNGNGWSYFGEPFSGVVTLDPLRFVVGASATTTMHRIIYHPDSGTLYYDPDGLGPESAIKFARLSPNLALTNSNFRSYYRARPM